MRAGVGERRRGASVRYLMLSIWGLFALFPVYWMGVTAFKKPKDIYQGP